MMQDEMQLSAETAAASPPETIARTVQTQVDALIDWYERNAPAMGTCIAVNARPATLATFAKKIRRGPYVYRGRILVPVKPKAQTEQRA